MQAELGAAHIFPKNGAQQRGSKPLPRRRERGKERIWEGETAQPCVCKKIGNCDTLCQRKYTERHGFMEKHRFQRDQKRKLCHEALYRRRKEHMDGKE